MAAGVVRLLEVDPDLGEDMDPEARERATASLRVRVFKVAKGRWEPPEIDHGSTGLLLLDGLMVRTLSLGPASSAEVVGPTDIIRPWETNLIPSVLPSTAEWRVLHDVRVALIDGRATAIIGHWPELAAAVSGRLLRRARSLSFLMAAQHFVRVEDRLLAALWHLASMWGRVTPQGTLVPFRLTHEMLGNIVGARRPTTTTAVRSLTSQGRLSQTHDRFWLLLGDPPDWSREKPPVAALEV
jgi:CRP/FNR family transcriptional regulator, cyclic AMP receptor protein